MSSTRMWSSLLGQFQSTSTPKSQSSGNRCHLVAHPQTHDARRDKECTESGDSMEMLSSSPGPARSPSKSHSHFNAHPYAYPSVKSSPPQCPSQFKPTHGYTYSYDSVPMLEYSATTATTASALPTSMVTPLPSSIGSAGTSRSGFETLGGTGLDQYSLKRRSSSRQDELLGEVSRPVKFEPVTGSPVEGCGLGGREG